ncbi:MAG: tetratricopeptide repeat protein [Spirulina sp. SIO3F2]|nr:tetratricopeptide repeat protein [Spirulina sp. SIO3F2]
MYQISLHWFTDLIKSWFNPDSPIPHPTEISPLTSDDYEALLVQITEGVAHGWQQAQLWERLDIRRHDPWFAAWLQRYGKTLLRQQPDQINREFAQRLIHLGVIGCGDLGETARGIGQRLLEASNRDRLQQVPSPPPVETFSSENPLELFDYGMELYRKGELEGALTLWQTALERQPTLYEARNACGVVLYSLGRGTEAIQAFDAILDQDAESITAWFNRGTVRLGQSDLAAAITDFNTALDLKPDLYHAYIARGNAYQRQQQWQLALADFEQAIALNANGYPAYNARGQVYSALERYDDALTSFSAALAIEPNCAEAYHNRGNVYYHLHQWETALEEFSQAILITPNFYQAYYSRGNLHLEQGKPNQAVADYREALNLRPDYLPAYNGRGLALSSLGQYTEAIADFNHVLNQNPQCWQAWANRGWAMYKAPEPLGPQVAIGNWQTALRELQSQAPPPPLAISTLYRYLGLACIQQAPQSADLQTVLKAAAQHYQAALDAIQDCPGLETHYLELLEQLIVIYARLGSSLHGKSHLNIALMILNQLLLNATTSAQKLQLMNRFQGLYQLKVDQLAQSTNPRHHAQALELAEERNSIRLQAYLDPKWDGQTGPTLTYPQIQRLLDTQTAIVYWHLSPASITVFLVVRHQPLLVITSNYEQRQALQHTWQQWQQHYEIVDSTTSDPTTAIADTPQAWRSHLTDVFPKLLNQLGIDPLLSRLPEAINRLILVPHKLLVALPIAALFGPPYCDRPLVVTQIPALQWAASLELTPELPTSPAESQPPLLTLDSPAGRLPHTELEVSAIAQFFQHLHLEHQATPPSRVLTQLQRPFNIFHCAGEGHLHLNEPLRSALQLVQDTTLNVSDLLKPTYSSPPLVCLSGTHVVGIGGSEQGESFLGLPAVFLSKGSSYVLVALWPVPEFSTPLLMWQFYAQLAQSIPPAQALGQVQDWLQTLTYAQIQELYADWQSKLTHISLRSQGDLEIAQRLVQERAERQGADRCPYEHPYYWAGFTMVGKVD